MPRASRPADPWFVRAFERLYLDVYPHRNDAEAEAHADSILRLLGARPGSRVLDAACGAGRYARALARRGLRMTGVDLSSDLIEEARERSPLTPGSPTYIRWDIRRLPFTGQFDAAISVFTSFGYFDDAAADAAVMQGVERALVPGGSFLLDFLNESHVRANLEPVSDVTVKALHLHMERRIEDDAPGGPVVVKSVSAIEVQTGLARAGYEERVRLYTADEIDALLEEANLEPVGDRRGGLDGSPFDAATSLRYVRVARKRGSAS